MRNNLFETIVGTLVLACAIFFLIFSFKKSNISTSDSYKILVDFDNIDGISTGSDIKISGVKIGTVNGQELNSQTYRARLELNIYKNIKLPIDSSAKIVSSGLLGSKYLDISPGSEDEMLSDSEEIVFSQSSVNFEELLGKFIFGSKQDEK